MKKTKKTKLLTIIVPVYNEQATIDKILQKVIAQKIPGWSKEIIVIDDGSIDNSPLQISHYTHWIKLITHDKNRGRGSSIRSALEVATGDAIIFQDADLEYDPRDWPKLLKRLEVPETAIVYGSRTINPKQKGYKAFVLGARFLTSFINVLYGSHLTDLYTGYKLFRRSTVESATLTKPGFEFEVELTSYFLKAGIPIAEVPISYNPRSFQDGKKITIVDGLKGLWYIFWYRFF